MPQSAVSKRTLSGIITDVWNRYAKGSRQIDLVILFLHENSANLFRHRKLSKPFTLPNSSVIIENGFVFIFQIEFEHFFRLFEVRTGLGITVGILPR